MAAPHRHPLNSALRRRLQVLQILQAAASAGVFDDCRSVREAEFTVEDLLGPDYEDLDVQPSLLVTPQYRIARRPGETDVQLGSRVHREMSRASRWVFTVNGSRLEDFE